MKLFQVVAAKNNQKVNLSVRHQNIEEARESLHSQGYSIIEIREITEAWTSDQKQSGGNKLYYFSVLNGAEIKNGQIYAIDILRAYKKLSEGLGYSIQYLYENPDSTIDEKSYVTAKAKEAYLEFKKYEKKEDVIVLPTNKEEQLITWPLQREMERYQGLIEKICIKIENLSTQWELFTPERIEQLRGLSVALRQAKQGTNIDKLKIIGEAALIKIGQLELEIQGDALEQKKNEFLKETNLLLKGVGSKKRVGSQTENLKQKFATFLWEITEKKEKSVETPKAEKETFAYYKNLRELSVYEERLRMVKAEIRTLFFKNNPRKQRLLLKKRLLKQNILIIHSRVSGKSISYSRVVKGMKYYADAATLTLRIFAQFMQYLIAGVIFFLSLQGVFIPGFSEKVWIIVLFLCIAALFGLLFRKVYSLSGLIAPSICFALIVFGLLVNF